MHAQVNRRQTFREQGSNIQTKKGRLEWSVKIQRIKGGREFESCSTYGGNIKWGEKTERKKEGRN